MANHHGKAALAVKAAIMYTRAEMLRLKGGKEIYYLLLFISFSFPVVYDKSCGCESLRVLVQ